MKKIISFILIAILCLGVLTSCDIIDSIKDKIGFGDQVDDAAADKAFNDAVMSLHRMYKDKAESTSVDFDLVSQVIVNGVKYPVTWTVDNEKVSIRESVNAGFYTVDLPDVNEEEFTYTITATITDGGERSEQKSYTFKMLVLDNSSVDTELKEGVAYKMFLVQGTFGQRMYALNTMQMGTGDGANYGKYIKTTLDPKAGADYYAEIVDGGYKWYTNIDGVKHYVFAQTLFESEDKKAENKFSKYIGLSTENASVFSYNAEMGGVWTVVIEGNTFGVGTYSDYKTICISEGSFFSTDVIGVSQFVLQFMTTEYANTLTPDEEQKINEPENNSTLTIPEINEHASQRPHNNYTDGKFYVTGTIDSVSNNQYGNLIIKDAEGNTLTIYGSYDATGANRYDAMANAPVVGDEVTLYGIIGNYNGTVQMKNAWIIAINGENQGDTPSTPSDRTFTLATELKTGDQVVIGAPAHGKLFSSTKTGYYNVGIDYSATNFANVTDAEIWVVTVNEDGSYTFTSLTTGKPIAMADSYSSFNEDGANKSWALVAKEGAEGIFYVKNTVRGNYIEWYADKNNWSSYATSDLSDLFELSFYVVAGGTDTPVDPEPTLTGKDLLDAAYALASGESMTGPYTLTGVITALDNWNNPTIVFGEYTEMPIYCYRLVDSRFVVGATITVTAGSIKNYNGTIEMMDCTLDSITVPGEDGGDNTDTPVVPEDGVYTIPQVLAAAEGTAVIVKGTVVEIYQAWSDQYSNISFYIADADGNRLLVFRTGTKVNIGDQVTVTGTATLYNSVIQIAQGGTTVIDVAHVCSEFTKATCTTAAACVVCGTVSSPALGHSYTNGTCINCGEPEPTSPAKTYHLQATIGETTYYWSGAASGGKGVITTSESEAVVLYVEEADNGYVHIYYVDGNGARQYLYFTDGNTGFKTSSDAKTIKYDEATGKVYEDSFSDTRYAATYGVQDIRSYKASNVPGSSNNAYMLLTPIA